MAIYHCKVQIISRSHGRSAVAAAAYRSRSKLHDDRIGKTHDYRKKGGLSHEQILLPDDADPRLKNRQHLWEEVERKETRTNSQLAREFIVALPKELSNEENIKLTRKFARDEFVKRGMIADICIHDLDKENPHAHIMLTMRKADKNGLKNEKKSAREWNKKDLLLQQRTAWSDHVNQALEQAKIDARIDHRSWKDKGIDHKPKVHLGWYAHKLEQKGVETDIGNLNRSIDELNALKKEQRRLDEEIALTKTEIAQEERLHQAVTITRHATHQQTAQELKQASIDEKAILKQLLDQQRDRERHRLRSDTTTTNQTDRSQNTLNQQLDNLNNAITEFAASVEKLQQTTQQKKSFRQKRQKNTEKYARKNHRDWDIER